MKVREIFQDKIFTISTILALVRIVAAPILGYFIYKEYQTGDTGYLFLVLLFYGLGGILYVKTYTRHYFEKKA